MKKIRQYCLVAIITILSGAVESYAEPDYGYSHHGWHHHPHGQYEGKEHRLWHHSEAEFPGTKEGKALESEYWERKTKLLKEAEELEKKVIECDQYSPEECEKTIEDLIELQAEIRELEEEEEAEIHLQKKGIGEALEELSELEEDFSDIESEITEPPEIEPEATIKEWELTY